MMALALVLTFAGAVGVHARAGRVNGSRLPSGLARRMVAARVPVVTNGCRSPDPETPVPQKRSCRVSSYQTG